MVAVAAKGKGKTHTSANDIIAPYIAINPKTGRPAKPVLIYDVNGEYNDRNLREKFKVKWTAKKLALKDLQKWVMYGENEVRRILPLNDKNEIEEDIDKMMAILVVILKTFRNGLLVLEDINAYMLDASSKEVVSRIIRNRQKNLDILIHFQTFRAIAPRIWGNLNILRFHKTNENISTVKEKLTNEELFYIAECLVNYMFKYVNARFHCFVDRENDLIFGAMFNLQQFKLACYIYIRYYKPVDYKNALNYYKGNDAKAVVYVVDDLLKYYGNKK